MACTRVLWVHGRRYQLELRYEGWVRFVSRAIPARPDLRNGYLDLLLGNYFKPVNLLDLKDPRVLPNDLDNATNGGGLNQDAGTVTASNSIIGHNTATNQRTRGLTP